MKSRLFLVPTPLGEMEPDNVLPAPVLSLISQIKLFFVEELRTARRFLSSAGLRGHIEELSLYELNEHTDIETIEQYVKLLKGDGKEPIDAALISEAGLPAVADPGSLLVELAHNNDIEVIPQVGPSSLMLALMSSGMNGQCFAFTGYIPVKKEERRAKIVQLEKISQQQHQTQIIIETPYRNDSLFGDLLAVCRPSTRICIAADITLPTSFIKTKSVEQWRKSIPEIGKRPCVFVMQG